MLLKSPTHSTLKPFNSEQQKINKTYVCLDVRESYSGTTYYLNILYNKTQQQKHTTSYATGYKVASRVIVT